MQCRTACDPLDTVLPLRICYGADDAVVNIKSAIYERKVPAQRLTRSLGGKRER